jgi:hypothetical protein
MGNFFSN